MVGDLDFEVDVDDFDVSAHVDQVARYHLEPSVRPQQHMEAKAKARAQGSGQKQAAHSSRLPSNLTGSM